MAAILVVEDDELMRETIATVMTRDGHDVVVASNGTEALSALVRFRPEVIILDILMPEIDGFEVLALIRERGITARVLAISGGGCGLSDELATSIAQASGASSVLSKPFSNDVLRRKVGDLIDAGAVS